MSSRIAKLAVLALALFGASVVEAQSTTAAGSTTAPAVTPAPVTATPAPVPATPAPVTVPPQAVYGAGSRISTVPLSQQFSTVDKTIAKDVFALLEAENQGYDPKGSNRLPTGFYGNGAAYDPAQQPYDGHSEFTAPNPASNANYSPNFVFLVNGRTFSSVGQLLSSNINTPGPLYTNTYPMPGVSSTPAPGYYAPYVPHNTRRRVLRL